MLSSRRRTHQRPWGRDQRTGAGPHSDYWNGPTLWPSPSTTLLLNLATNVPHTCHSGRSPPGSDGLSAPAVTSAGLPSRSVFERSRVVGLATDGRHAQDARIGTSARAAASLGCWAITWAASVLPRRGR